jgi:hypothetical protein
MWLIGKTDDKRDNRIFWCPRCGTYKNGNRISKPSWSEERAIIETLDKIAPQESRTIGVVI